MADILEEDEYGTPLIAELYKPPALLPIAQLRDPLLYAIENYPVTVIVRILVQLSKRLTNIIFLQVGETGSGKTSKLGAYGICKTCAHHCKAQIPQFLYGAGWTNDGSQIAITQPRRIAATVSSSKARSKDVR